jgi:hypothetical protein
MYEMPIPGLVTYILAIVLGMVDFGFVVFGSRLARSSVSSFFVSRGLKSPVFVSVWAATFSHLFWYMEHPKAPELFTAGIVWNKYTIIQCACAVISWEGVRRLLFGK